MFPFKHQIQSHLTVKTLVFLIALKLVLIWLMITLLSYYSRSVRAIISNQLIIPEMTVYNETELFLLAEKESNLALIYWSQWKAINKENVWSDKNLSVCSNVDLPKPNEIFFNNIYYQQFIVNRNVTLYLYNAYLDNRQSVSTVKIIAMTDNQNEANKTNVWCLLWFENYRKPVLSKVSSIYVFCPYDWSRGRGVYGPLYMACDIPNTLKHLVPKAVSLTLYDSCVSNNGRKLTNNLRVIYNKPAVREEFGVCVKHLRFDLRFDYSVRLIEWLEMLKILGANKVFLYKLGAHPNMVKVLQYYSNNNFVDWRRLTLPGTEFNNQYLYHWFEDHQPLRSGTPEMLDLNDCIYRNLYNYKYIAVIDVDELIVPITAYNWSQLMTEVQESINDKSLVKSYGYYENINSHFYSNLETNKLIVNDNEGNSEVESYIPSYMHTMRHVYRNEFTSPGNNIKCFHNTDLVEAVHNHFPLKCIGKRGLYWNCDGHRINTNHSHLFHYKNEIIKPKECNNTDIKECAIYDTTLWKYYYQLNTNMEVVLKNIFS